MTWTVPPLRLSVLCASAHIGGDSTACSLSNRQGLGAGVKEAHAVGFVIAFRPGGGDMLLEFLESNRVELTISRSAVQACERELRVRDIPGVGCVFTIDLPGRIESRVEETVLEP